MSKISINFTKKNLLKFCTQFSENSRKCLIISRNSGKWIISTNFDKFIQFIKSKIIFEKILVNFNRETSKTVEKIFRKFCSKGKIT